MQPDFPKYDFCISISDHVSVISGRFDEYEVRYNLLTVRLQSSGGDCIRQKDVV